MYQVFILPFINTYYISHKEEVFLPIIPLGLCQRKFYKSTQDIGMKRICKVRLHILGFMALKDSGSQDIDKSWSSIYQ